MAVGQFDISEFQVHGFIMKAKTRCVKDSVSSSVHTLLKVLKGDFFCSGAMKEP